MRAKGIMGLLPVVLINAKLILNIHVDGGLFLLSLHTTPFTTSSLVHLENKDRIAESVS